MSPFNTSDQPIMSGDLVTPSGSDVTIATNVRYLRVGGAGNLVLRYPGSAADITVAATAGEYVPAGPGTIIRNSGTTATTIHALGC